MIQKYQSPSVCLWDIFLTSLCGSADLSPCLKAISECNGQPDGSLIQAASLCQSAKGNKDWSVCAWGGCYGLYVNEGSVGSGLGRSHCSGISDLISDAQNILLGLQRLGGSEETTGAPPSLSLWKALGEHVATTQIAFVNHITTHTHIHTPHGTPLQIYAGNTLFMNL